MILIQRTQLPALPGSCKTMAFEAMSQSVSKAAKASVAGLINSGAAEFSESQEEAKISRTCTQNLDLTAALFTLAHKIMSKTWL